MNKERMQALADYMSKDEERAATLFGMNVDDALERINADGYDFTAEELREFANGLETVSVSNGNGELDADALNEVSGGFVATCTAIYCAAVGVYVGATALRAYGVSKGYWR